MTLLQARSASQDARKHTVSVVLPIGYSAALSVLAMLSNEDEQNVLIGLLDQAKASDLMPFDWSPDGQRSEYRLSDGTLAKLDAAASEAELSRAHVIMSIIRFAFHARAGIPFPHDVPRLEARRWFDQHSTGAAA